MVTLGEHSGIWSFGFSVGLILGIIITWMICKAKEVKKAGKEE